LRLANTFNQKISNLPTELLLLYLDVHFRSELSNLPPTLKYLRISEGCFVTLEILPKSVTHLAWGTEIYEKSNAAIFPPNLERLKINTSYTAPDCHLPATLKHLSVRYSMTFAGKFPLNLKHLDWDDLIIS
jgi:hypothetical protein